MLNFFASLFRKKPTVVPPSIYKAPVVIAFINQSTVMTDAQVTPIVNALQIQTSRDFAPVWGVDAALIQVLKGQPAPKGAWQMILLDNADQAGALGYHETSSEGLPLGKCFIKTDLDNGALPSVTISHELCFTGDTKIKLLDGTEPCIKDLVGREEFWVYSLDEKQNLVPGRGFGARLTKKNSQLVKVTLDNGETIRCTPDHRFMMRDGSYKEAQFLETDDSLMPLYIKNKILDSNKSRKGMYEYQHVYDLNKDKWIPTHRLVLKNCPENHVRHHKDFNRLNNSPENLEILSWEAHQKLHSEHITQYHAIAIANNQKRIDDGTHHFLKANRTPEYVEAHKNRLIEYNKSEKHTQDMKKYFARPGVLEMVAERFKKLSSSFENIARVSELNKSPERREISRQIMIAYNKSDAHKEVAKQSGKNAMSKLWSNPEFRQAHSERVKLAAHKKWHLDRSIVKSDCELCMVPANHKITIVEFLSEIEDVYDFTVEQHHNFALASGVFVHNCEMLADPFIFSTVFVQRSNTAGKLYSLEVCDATEADIFAYDVNGVKVSDFVYPGWFDVQGWSGKLDHMSHITSPLQLLPGGYISEFDVARGTGWQQIQAQEILHAHRHVINPGSRRERRRRPQDTWRKSEI
jgi:hypothetical protein